MGKLTDDEVAQIGKALGDPNRPQSMRRLHISMSFPAARSSRNEISAPTLSHDLKILADLGLITSRKDGVNVFYRPVPERFAAYLKYLTVIGPRLHG
jgi:ArsR family transcriptional regulator